MRSLVNDKAPPLSIFYPLTGEKRIGSEKCFLTSLFDVAGERCMNVAASRAVCLFSFRVNTPRLCREIPMNRYLIGLPRGSSFVWTFSKASGGGMELVVQ